MIVEFLMAKWVEVIAVILLMGCLLIFAFVGMCARDLIEKYDEEERAKELSKKEKAELKKMMPELPKEDK